MLKVIDISSHNSIDTAGMGGIDGVIVKTTQGTGYVNPSADQQWQLAKKSGRLLGFYHYAGGGNPVSEADYFIKHSKGYFYHGIPVIDWESYQNASWGDYNWVRKFVNRVHEVTGVWCMIYIQASSLPQAANCAKDCPLWIAGYPTNAANWDVPKFIYSTNPWSTYTLWQFTSGGGLDRNVANIDATGWKKIADPNNVLGSSKPNEKPVEKPQQKPSEGYSTKNKTIWKMSDDVEKGLVGNGETRKKNLGKFYKGVQAVVDYHMGGTKANAMKVLASEVKNGVYGNGDARKAILGNYYDDVQKIVNGTPTKRTYTVVSGDTMSGIGAKLGVNWQTLAANNGIKGPSYMIHPGQKLTY